jgi:drug/metabolite transporter (DMT)-like permease
MDTLSMVLVAALWGGFFVVGKLAVSDVAPLVVGTWRFLVAAPFFVLLLLAVRGKERSPGMRDFPLLLGLGVTGIFAYNWLAFEGMRLASAADGAMISPTLNPILTMVLAGWLFGESITRQRVLGIALAIFGELLVFQDAIVGMHAHPERLWGDLYYLASAVCWSAFTLLGRVAASRLGPITTSAYSSLIGAFLLLVVTGPGVLNVPTTGSPALRFWLAIAFMAVGGTVLALVLWNRGIAKLGAVKAASYTYLVPVFAIGMSVVFLHERPSVVQVVGCGLVLAGVAIANRRPAARPQPEAA